MSQIPPSQTAAAKRWSSATPRATKDDPAPSPRMAIRCSSTSSRRRQVIHHGVDRRFQIGTADHLVEFGADAGAEEIHGQQRHSPLARVTRHLEEVLFLPMSGIAHAHDDRRSVGSVRRRRQEIAFQRVAFQPGNLDHLAGRRQMRDVAAGARRACSPQASCRFFVGSVECERRALIVIDGAKPVVPRRQQVASSSAAMPRSLLGSAVSVHS